MSVIREYDPVRDAGAVRECFIALQEFERRLDPELPPGEVVADAYLERMFTRCRETDGQVFVAEVDNTVVGFVSVWAKIQSDEPDEARTEYAYISDVAVLEPYRGQGLGRALLERAEQYVGEKNVTTLRLVVLSENTAAKQLYFSVGFTERYVQLTKRLGAEPDTPESFPRRQK